MKPTIKIATRKSPMALWQANFIKNKLLDLYPDFNIRLIGLVTKGDKELNQPIAKLGGKSVFVKELQSALLNQKADIAVHCIKDMSVLPTPNLTIGAICERNDPRDVFISNHFDRLDQLPKNAVVGTSSPRRQSLIKAMRPDLNMQVLRGNVNTRLAKLDADQYDGIILAAAGLSRLGLNDRIKQYFDPNTFTPAIGQGALGIECLADDQEILDLIQPLHHQATAICINAERVVNQKLGGDCHTPIGAFAELQNDQLILRAVVGAIDGKKILRAQKKGPACESEQIGYNVADELIEKGAKAFL